MRKVAAYALESSGSDTSASSLLYEVASTAVDRWLEEKGSAIDDTGQFQFNRGHKGQLISTVSRTEDGEIRRVGLLERIEGGVFVTDISIAKLRTNCAVFVELRAASGGQHLAPFQYDVRRPKFIGELLDGDPNWFLGETLLVNRPYHFSGAQGAINLVKLIWHPDRSVPLVLVSTEKGQSITENFVAKVAGDLSGLAIVGTVDESASWALTELKGAEWSCFDGAVRLYWPVASGMTGARSHPFWTKSTLFRGVSEPRDASYRIRSQLRRQILGISAFSIREPKVTREIRSNLRGLRRVELENGLRASVSADDYKEIAESYAQDNDHLRDELKQKEERLNELEDQVENLQVALRFASVEESTVPPDEPGEPRDVSESVARAIEIFKGELLFSDDIKEGLADLHPDAGPPDKVLRYLSALAELAKARADGSLGEGVVPWLASKGIICSVESESVRRSRTDMRKRTWMFSGEPVEFDFHLKPSDNVSPDKCVRIYFDLPSAGSQTRVGWVGRHPE